MTLIFKSCLENEAFARTSATAFLMPLNPNVEELMEIKTILAEAVVNCMIHGYEGSEDGNITVHIRYEGNVVDICVRDEGCGIEDIDLADEFHVTSTPGKGTAISIKKILHDTHEDSR